MVEITNKNYKETYVLVSMITNTIRTSVVIALLRALGNYSRDYPLAKVILA